MNWWVEFYQEADGTGPVKEFLMGLNIPTRQKIFSYLDLLEERGLLPYPYSRKIEGIKKLRELRVEFASNIYRIFYFVHKEKQIILLHGFTKKSQKIPPKELAVAQRRLKDFLGRVKNEKGV